MYHGFSKLLYREMKTQIENELFLRAYATFQKIAFYLSSVMINVRLQTCNVYNSLGQLLLNVYQRPLPETVHIVLNPR